jgi:hypothetical protein
MAAACVDVSACTLSREDDSQSQVACAYQQDGGAELALHVAEPLREAERRRRHDDGDEQDVYGWVQGAPTKEGLTDDMST